MCVDFGSHLDHLFDEMYQMNTRISRIARCQSHLGGFAPSPGLAEESSSGGDDDDPDGSSSSSDDELTTSQ